MKRRMWSLTIGGRSITFCLVVLTFVIIVEMIIMLLSDVSRSLNDSAPGEPKKSRPAGGVEAEAPGIEVEAPEKPRDKKRFSAIVVETPPCACSRKNLINLKSAPFFDALDAGKNDISRESASNREIQRHLHWPLPYGFVFDLRAASFSKRLPLLTAARNNHNHFRSRINHIFSDAPPADCTEAAKTRARTGACTRCKCDTKALTCAVVGVGGSLVGAGLGPEIDAHSVVFRSGVAPTRGFEKEVGGRTSVYLASPKALKRFLNHPHSLKDADKGYQVVFLLTEDEDAENLFAILPPEAPLSGESHLTKEHRRNWNELKDEAFEAKKRNWDKLLGDNFIEKQAKDFHVINPLLIQEVAHEFLGIKNFTADRQIRPSSGFLSTILALHFCDSVTLYGFDLGRGRLLYYHHRSPPNFEVSWAASVVVEHKYFEEWERKGIVNWVL